jgi:hypothetical protein
MCRGIAGLARARRRLQVPEAARAPQAAQTEPRSGAPHEQSRTAASAGAGAVGPATGRRIPQREQTRSPGSAGVRQ